MRPPTSAERGLDTAVVAPPPSDSDSEAEAASGGVAFNRLVIGRCRQHRIDLRLVRGSIADGDSRACVLALFKDVTPTGPAHYAAYDFRLKVTA